MAICFGISTIAKLWKWHVNNLNTKPGFEAERLLTGSGKRTELFWPACWKSAAADLLFKKNLRLCRSDATQNILQRKRIGFVLRNRFHMFGLIKSVFSIPATARECMFSRAWSEWSLPDLCD